MENNLFEQKHEPDLLIPFRVVLSWNDVLSQIPSLVKCRYAGQVITNRLGGEVKKWRRRGRKRAVAVCSDMGYAITEIERQTRKPDKKRGGYKTEKFAGLKEIFFDEKVVCIVRMWRASNANYDVHNPFIKPILDGFVDVGIMQDDSFKYLVDVIFHFEGVDPSLQLTGIEKEKRQKLIKKRKNTNKRMPPVPARFDFEFYRASRFPNGSPIATPEPLKTV